MTVQRKMICFLTYLITCSILSTFICICLQSHIESINKIKQLEHEVKLLMNEISKSNPCLTNREDYQPQTACKIVMDKSNMAKPNFAAASLGAEIVSVHNTKLMCFTDNSWLKYVLGCYWTNHPPQYLLKNSLVPGKCFAFHGHRGSVTIKLIAEIFIDEIVIRHVTKDMIPAVDGQLMDNAPKLFSVSAMVSEDSEPSLCGTFEYDITAGKSNQPFNLKNSVCSKSRYRFIRINFESNHGNRSHTCVYRILVHGNSS